MPFHMIIILISSLLVSGCAFTDRYSDRAKVYNTESEDFYNETILLNIVRASHRVPLQFTDLQTVTGQTTSSGSISLISPVGGFPAATTRTINPMVGGSTQTIFAAAVLNSQEFYQGISSPISGVEASYFVRSVRPAELVFDLLFERVTLYRNDGICKDERNRYLLECALAFRNNPRNRQAFGLFQSTIEYMIRLGLSMESIKIKNHEVKSDLDAKSKLKSQSDTEKDDSARDVARYCFRPHFVTDVKLIADPKFLCGRKLALEFFEKTADETDQSPTVKLNDDLIKTYVAILNQAKLDMEGGEERDPEDDPSELQKVLPNFNGTQVRVELTQRSTIDIFNYLGSVIAAERNFGPDAALIRDVVPQKTGMLPCGYEPDPKCDPLFHLGPTPDDSVMSVDDRGHRVFVSADQKVGGYTAYTVSILKQILGLNTSSKNVPSPAIITGVPPL